MSKKKQIRSRMMKSSANPSVTSVDSSANFNPDYSYVIKDLKRIGLLAGLFFAVLVGIAILMPVLGK